MSRPVTSMQQPLPSCSRRTRQPVSMATKSKPTEITTDTDDTLHEEPQHPQFEPGERVRDIYGRMHVVVEQVGCAVFVVGGGWFHPTKVFPV